MKWRKRESGLVVPNDEVRGYRGGPFYHGRQPGQARIGTGQIGQNVAFSLTFSARWNLSAPPDV